MEYWFILVFCVASHVPKSLLYEGNETEAHKKVLPSPNISHHQDVNDRVTVVSCNNQNLGSV
jgi:hypothetical protein